MAESVVGQGIDLVEVSRVGESLEKHGERFLKRVFTSGEIEYSMGHKYPAVHLAARFSAKEAVSKAFGTGIGKQLGWQDIEVCRKESGEPYVVLHGKGRELAQARGVSKVLVSLTHTKEYAAASAVLVGL